MTKLPKDINIQDIEEYSAFKKSIWFKGKPITKQEVLDCIKQNKLMHPDRVLKGNNFIPCTRQQHIERIAWLVLNVKDDPITLNIKAPHPIIDGNHRLAAAIIRGDLTIKIN